MLTEKGEYKVLYLDLRQYEDRFFVIYCMSVGRWIASNGYSFDWETEH